MPKLSKRLEILASLVPFGARVCDIGTDHAFLAIELMRTKRACSVIATDINEKPLQKAKINVEKSEQSGIILRLCDGLAAVESGEVDTVIVLGMGGEVIAGILDRADWLKNEDITLILQPMTSSWLLREYLYKNGFDIIKEPTLIEKGKVYSVMQVRFDGKVRNADMASATIGKIETVTASDILYLKKQYIRCNQCAIKLEKVEEKRQEYIEYSDTALKIKTILEEHNAI